MDYFIIQLCEKKFEYIPPLAKKLLNDYICSKNKKFQYYDITNYNNNNEILTKNASKLIELCSNILLNYNFKIDPTQYHIDIHSYNLKNEIYNTPLVWHKDDMMATNYNVHTLIIYLIKDESINGGNLYYYKNNIKKKIIINNNTIILMDGRIMHNPENMHGSGKRDLLVVKFKRL